MEIPERFLKDKNVVDAKSNGKVSLDRRAHDITIAYLTRYGIKGEFMSDPSAWAFTSKYSLAYQTVVAKLRQMDFKLAEGKGEKA